MQARGQRFFASSAKLSVFARLVLVASFGLHGCGDSREPTTARQCFDGKRFGSSADYGLMKNGNDHVATFHGFLDDEEACREVAAIFSREGGHWSCVALNR